MSERLRRLAEWVIYYWPQCKSPLVFQYSWGRGGVLPARITTYCIRPKWHTGPHEDIDERVWHTTTGGMSA